MAEDRIKNTEDAMATIEDAMATIEDAMAILDGIVKVFPSIENRLAASEWAIGILKAEMVDVTSQVVLSMGRITDIDRTHQIIAQQLRLVADSLEQ